MDMVHFYPNFLLYHWSQVYVQYEYTDTNFARQKPVTDGICGDYYLTSKVPNKIGRITCQQRLELNARLVFPVLFTMLCSLRVRFVHNIFH